MNRPRRIARALLLLAGALAVIVLDAPLLDAQAAPAVPDVPNPPPIIGRDSDEPGEVIGKQFSLKVWLSDVGGPGIQKIYVARLGADGNIAVPGSAPQHAEGLTIAALEAQVAAPYKAASPNAKAWITIVDRNPPPPPPPAPPPAPSPPPPAPAPQAATKPAATQIVAPATPATAPAPNPAKQ
jgi:hypothetical protein